MATRPVMQWCLSQALRPLNPQCNSRHDDDPGDIGEHVEAVLPAEIDVLSTIASPSMVITSPVKNESVAASLSKTTLMWSDFVIVMFPVFQRPCEEIPAARSSELDGDSRDNAGDKRAGRLKASQVDASPVLTGDILVLQTIDY